MIEPEIEEFPLALECSNGRQPSGGLHIKVHYVSSQKKNLILACPTNFRHQIRFWLHTFSPGKEST